MPVVGRVVQVVAAILVFAAIGLAVMALRGDLRNDRSLAVGDCVRQGGPDRMEEVSCSSEQAFGKVMKTYEGDFFGPTDCPAETDASGASACRPPCAFAT